MSGFIRLSALIGTNPLGALASFGLLRLVESWDPEAKLSFVMEDDWIAVLHTETHATLEELIFHLTEWVESDRLDSLLDWADDVRVPPKVYQEILARTIDGNNREIADFISAIAADGAVDRQKGLIKPSAFYMVSGQQTFLGGAKDIVTAARLDARATFEEALAGPWAYRTRLHSLGWDSSTERLHALRGRAPTSEKPACVAGAVLLALWALPMFPSVSQSGRPQTIGFSKIKDDWIFSWPIFSRPIDLAELTSIVQTQAWTSRDGSLRAGIETVYRSRRAEFGQGYAIFRPAQAAPLHDQNVG